MRAENRSQTMLSLCIQTKNRPEFLIRLLTYYYDLGFPGPIFIGDLSNHREHLDRVKEAVRGFSGRLDILDTEYPDASGDGCNRQLLDLVSTPYVAFVSDDDFVVPSALHRCVQFLENCPGYSSAHGLATLFQVEANAAYGAVKDAGHYRQPVFAAATASQRLTSLLSNYSVPLFSVHRAETWRAMYRNTFLIQEWRHFGAELLPCCISAIKGSAKQLDCLQMARQVRDATYDPLGGVDNSGGDGQAAINASASHLKGLAWLASKNWLPSYEIFRNLVADELAREDGISQGQAQDVVTQAFQMYLANMLSEKSGLRTCGSRERLLRTARAMPLVRWAWRNVTPFMSGDRCQMPITALLRRSSPYHTDFMPIYQAITSTSMSVANLMSMPYSMERT